LASVQDDELQWAPEQISAPEEGLMYIINFMILCFFDGKQSPNNNEDDCKIGCGVL